VRFRKEIRDREKENEGAPFTREIRYAEKENEGVGF
jgi:hypothetical protein